MKNVSCSCQSASCCFSESDPFAQRCDAFSEVRSLRSWGRRAARWRARWRQGSADMGHEIGKWSDQDYASLASAQAGGSMFRKHRLLHCICFAENATFRVKAFPEQSQRLHLAESGRHSDEEDSVWLTCTEVLQSGMHSHRCNSVLDANIERDAELPRRHAEEAEVLCVWTERIKSGTEGGQPTFRLRTCNQERHLIRSGIPSRSRGYVLVK
jgi:hypothetical protein